MLQHAAPSITVLARLVRHTKRSEHHGQERMQTHSDSLLYVLSSLAYHAIRPCNISLPLCLVKHLGHGVSRTEYV